MPQDFAGNRARNLVLQSDNCNFAFYFAVIVLFSFLQMAFK
jgi:hypothetical protein